MTITTDEALAALRVADPAADTPASGVTADAVVARAEQAEPGTGVAPASNLDLHVAARREAGRGHRVRTALAVAATVVALAGLAIAVTHSSSETSSPGPARSGAITSGPVRPEWSILTGITAVDITSPDGSRTIAVDPTQLRQFMLDINQLPLDGGGTNLPKCPAPPARPLTAAFRVGTRVVALATDGGNCATTFSLKILGHGTVVLMGVRLGDLTFGLH